MNPKCAYSASPMVIVRQQQIQNVVMTMLVPHVQLMKIVMVLQIDKSVRLEMENVYNVWLMKIVKLAHQNVDLQIYVLPVALQARIVMFKALLYVILILLHVLNV